MAKTCQRNGVTIAPPPIPAGSRIPLTPVALHILLCCTVMFTWPNRQEPVSSIQPSGNQIVPAEEILPRLTCSLIEINGELATHFERICGHKGYSYDALEFNHRMEEYLVQNLAKKKQTAGVADSTKAMENDLIAAKHPGFNRGRVPGSVMREIGYHDCDWISFEDKWMTWERVASFAATIPLKLEMHVPCRDPLPHLMSQCNHWGKHFDCNATDMVAEVEKCLFKMDRYNDQLKKMTNVHLKCFNPIPIDSYVGYMSGILQPRRISTKYVHRETNRPRDKDKECIWSNPEIAEKVNAILLKTPYYRFCDQCMGSHDDLLAQ